MFSLAPQERGRSSSVHHAGLPPASPGNLRGRPPLNHRSSSAVAGPVLEPVAPSRLIQPQGSSARPFLPSPQPNPHRRRSSIDRLSQLLRGPPTTPQPPPRPSAPPTGVGVPVRTRNIVYAYIVFNEFCLELASLCCEHGVSFATALPQLERALDLEHCLAEL